MRERFGRELWWTLNLVVCWVGGVLMSLMGHMGWGYRRIFFLISKKTLLMKA
jgi:hypothetical protein